MRTRFLLTLILIALIGGTACNRSSKPAKQSIFMKRATGFAYEVLVVMDKDAWKGEAGRLLYDQLTAPIPGLPQNEPAIGIENCRKRLELLYADRFTLDVSQRDHKFHILLTIKLQ